ncbi:MAG TPA: hypothetical protein VNJ71_12730 [Gemmatimonadales bacterium]|jgi:hypothetical protein|nr:hypothetical protein [Gemmatimonadales bacterium]
MLHRQSVVVTMLGALALTGALIACGDGSGPSRSTCLNTLVGIYTLDSIRFTPPGGVLANPIATGTFDARSDTLYVANFDIQGQGATYDSGSYCVTGTNRFTQSSFVNPVQFVGTAVLTGNQLAVDVTGAGQQVEIWATKLIPTLQ